MDIIILAKLIVGLAALGVCSYGIAVCGRLGLVRDGSRYVGSCWSWTAFLGGGLGMLLAGLGLAFLMIWIPLDW